MYALIGAVALLVIASVLVRVLARIHRERDYAELRLRIKTWWLIVIVFCFAIAFHRNVSLVVFAFVSFLAFKEYLSLIPTRRADHRALFWAYLAIPVQYYWVGIEWYGMFIIFIPVFAFLYLPMKMVLIGETQGFLRAASTLHWGLMTTVFSLSHMAYLLALPDDKNPAGGGDALLFYLVFLTQINDVAQYVWGKSFGRHKATPTVSPNKTIEGRYVIKTFGTDGEARNPFGIFTVYHDTIGRYRCEQFAYEGGNWSQEPWRSITYDSARHEETRVAQQASGVTLDDE